MKKLIFFLCLMTSMRIAAQNITPCGTTYEDQLLWENRLIANVKYAEQHSASDNDAITYVPVYFHLVADADGTGRFRINKVLDALCILNSDYAEHEIQFYLSTHPNATYGLFDRSINNVNVYENQSNSFLMNLRKHPNAINYYIAANAASNTGQLGITLGYYTPAQDWIVLRKQNTAESSTISHETGHFLSLAHTFKGWELDGQADDQLPCFESGDPGWPIAPPTSPGGEPTEKMDGSNCTTAADRICDTPPDYNFGACQTGCAPYAGGAMDPMGVLVDPMENNFMSYFNGCGDYIFTPGQEAAMKADIASSDRNFLDNTFAPVATSFTTPDNLLVAPDNSGFPPYYDAVNLEWNAVAGATKYLIEVDRINTFATADALEIVTTNTSVEITTLAANKKYYWRVRPFNEYYTCAAAKSRSFTTSTTSIGTISTNNIQQVIGWQVAPNPTEGAQNVQISVNTAGGFEGIVRITDAAGRQAFVQTNIKIPVGSTTIEVPVNNLTNGIYFVSLENGQQREVKKLVVLN